MAAEHYSKPDVSADVDLALEALQLIDVTLLRDYDKVVLDLEASYQMLRGEQGWTGELYPQIPVQSGLAHPRTMWRLLAGGVRPVIYDMKMVGPDGGKGQTSIAELNRMFLDDAEPEEMPIHGRLALHSGANGRQLADPLLHFPNTSSGPSLGTEQQDKLHGVRLLQEEYQSHYPGYNLGILNTSAFLMLALIRQIKGERPPLEWSPHPHSIPAITIPTRENGTHALISMVKSGSFAPHAGTVEASPLQQVRGVGLSLGSNRSFQR